MEKENYIQSAHICELESRILAMEKYLDSLSKLNTFSRMTQSELFDLRQQCNDEIKSRYKFLKTYL